MAPVVGIVNATELPTPHDGRHEGGPYDICVPLPEKAIINEYTMIHEAKQLPTEHMAWIPGGTFLMGSDRHYPEEAPAHCVTVDGFWMDIYAVTNQQFRQFVEATGYITVAERPLNPADYPGALPELLVPGSAVFQKPPYRVDLRNVGNWWAYIPR